MEFRRSFAAALGYDRVLKTAVVVTMAIVYCVCLAGCKATEDEHSTPDHDLDENFRSDTLVIETDSGESYEFDIYLALTNEQHKRGLMFVRDLPARTGMLFVYDDSTLRSMWMKNTFIPLDLVFARRDGRITSVIHNTRPLSLASHRSTEPVAYVLELNGGTAKRFGIGKDSRIVWD